MIESFMLIANETVAEHFTRETTVHLPDMKIKGRKSTEVYRLCF